MNVWRYRYKVIAGDRSARRRHPGTPVEVLGKLIQSFCPELWGGARHLTGFRPASGRACPGHGSADDGPPGLDVEAVRERYSSLGPGFSFGAPGGRRCPTRSACDSRRVARGERQPRCSYETRPAGRADPRRRQGSRRPLARLRRGRGRVQGEHDDLDFALRTLARPEERRRDPRDPPRPRRGRGPWVELGADLGLEDAARRPTRRPDARLRRSRAEASERTRGGVRLGLERGGRRTGRRARVLPGA